MIRASVPDGLNGWYGSDEIGVRFHGQGDADLVYKGHDFNYWDIEGALWDMYLEDGGDEGDDDAFAAYVRENAPAYMDDVMAFGYFAPGSTSWHDSYR